MRTQIIKILHEQKKKKKKKKEKKKKKKNAKKQRFNNTIRQCLPSRLYAVSVCDRRGIVGLNLVEEKIRIAAERREDIRQVNALSLHTILQMLAKTGWTKRSNRYRSKKNRRDENPTPIISHTFVLLRSGFNTMARLMFLQLAR
jgi:hypothetical protein